MRAYTNIYKIASDILSSTEEEVSDIIRYYTTYKQDEDETDEDFEERIEKEYVKIRAKAFRKIADILESQAKE